MTIRELVDEFTDARPTVSGIAIRVRRISWPLPYEPRSRWCRVKLLPADADETTVMDARRSVLLDARHFAVCGECRQRRPVGWMSDARLCQSCAERNHGVVY